MAHAAALETLRRLYRLLPAAWRVQVRRGLSAAMTLGGDRHARRMRQEIARFSGETEVNDLPPIYHYWSNRHLRPLIEAFGFAYPEDFFARTIADHTARIGRAPRIVSLGCGNGDTEVRVAKLLLARGVAAFELRCLDITPAMLDRGRALAQAEGVDAHVRFEIADFNTWRAQAPADVVLANQCLHHVVALEHLFDAIASAIGDDGLFVTSDVIGRNGHQRWPEALAALQELWQELPDAYRYNRQLHRHETRFRDWNCAVEGFEGIRAQDILPLMIERFGFRFFFAYGNLITPFVDRSFGPHFSPDRAWDREFIDRVHARDDAGILAGAFTPTHLMAVLCNDRAATPVIRAHLTPGFCVRRP